MKSSFRILPLGAALVLFFTGLLASFAEEQAVADTEKTTAAKSSADNPSAPTPASVPEPPPAPAEASPPAPLRRLDAPEDEVPSLRARADAIRQRAEETRRRAEESRQRDRERADEERARNRQWDARRTHRAVVNIFADSMLPPGETTDNVVAIFGSSRSEGEVVDSVVAVFGNSSAHGPVGNAVVGVFGNVEVNSHVRGVVGVFGNVELGPNAEIDEEVICVFGKVQRDPAAIVHHQVQNFGGNLPFGEGFKTWFTECLLLGRPLAFNHLLGWAWAIAGALLVFYVFLALVFRGGIEKCMRTLETRPGASALTAIGTVVFSPFLVVLLCLTVVGVALVPFIGMGMTIAALFGKAVMLAWLGRRFTKFFGDGPLGHPAFAVLIGGLVVLLLYTVPFLGFLTYKLVGWMGLGVVVYTVLVATRREKPLVPVGVPLVSPPALPGAFAGGLAGALPPAISAVTLPRAGFWIRLAALALDAVLMGVCCAFLGDILPGNSHIRIQPPQWLMLLAVYGALMWKFRGTTIGGIVCGLKVVRLDAREVDWATAIVRALGCFLSLIVAGLGFIWVAIDDEKQSWHDKIAGTTVVRVPKGFSLL